jgi:hypothetical protein
VVFAECRVLDFDVEARVLVDWLGKVSVFTALIPAKR